MVSAAYFYGLSSLYNLAYLFDIFESFGLGENPKERFP
jgi:hypothetical protein